MSTQVRLRADAARNRERILQEARALFSTASETPPSLEGIAKAAGVGIGTLYRHFPTKETLVEAVYQAELDLLDTEAATVLGQLSGADAMRRWMDAYAQFVATKHAMHDALRIALAPKSGAGSEMRSRINRTLAAFLEAGVRDRSIRGGIRAEDLTLMLAGAVFAATALEDREQVARVLDLIMAGLRAPA